MDGMNDIGTVYVTGGSSGLGAAVAGAVAKAGGTPGVIDRIPP
jgi:NAD(P)-dependent dehydrogenase (short-subunit alcohol dehydrogenase family)